MVENRKKHRQNSYLIIPFPTSEGASERVSAAEGASNLEQATSERCERKSKRTSKWPCTYAPILCCFEPLPSCVHLHVPPRKRPPFVRARVFVSVCVWISDDDDDDDDHKFPLQLHSVELT